MTPAPDRAAFEAVLIKISDGEALYMFNALAIYDDLRAERDELKRAQDDWIRLGRTPELDALRTERDAAVEASTANFDELVRVRRAASDLLDHTDDLRDCWRPEIVRPKDGGVDQASSNMEHNHLTHEAIADLRSALVLRAERDAAVARAEKAERGDMFRAGVEASANCIEEHGHECAGWGFLVEHVRALCSQPVSSTVNDELRSLRAEVAALTEQVQRNEADVAYHLTMERNVLAKQVDVLAADNERLRAACGEAIQDLSHMPVDSPYQPSAIIANLRAILAPRETP